MSAISKPRLQELKDRTGSPLTNGELDTLLKLYERIDAIDPSYDARRFMKKNNFIGFDGVVAHLLYGIKMNTL